MQDRIEKKRGRYRTDRFCGSPKIGFDVFFLCLCILFLRPRDRGCIPFIDTSSSSSSSSVISLSLSLSPSRPLSAAGACDSSPAQLVSSFFPSSVSPTMDLNRIFMPEQIEVSTGGKTLLSCRRTWLFSTTDTPQRIGKRTFDFHKTLLLSTRYYYAVCIGIGFGGCHSIWKQPVRTTCIRRLGLRTQGCSPLAYSKQPIDASSVQHRKPSTQSHGLCALRSYYWNVARRV